MCVIAPLSVGPLSSNVLTGYHSMKDSSSWRRYEEAAAASAPIQNRKRNVNFQEVLE